MLLSSGVSSSGSVALSTTIPAPLATAANLALGPRRWVLVTNPNAAGILLGGDQAATCIFPLAAGQSTTVLWSGGGLYALGTVAAQTATILEGY